MMTETGSADFSSVPVDVRDGKLGDQIILGSSGAKENVGRELEGTVGINDGSDLDTLGWIQMLVLVAVTFKMGNCVLRTRGMEVGMAMLLCCGTGSDHSMLERTGSWMEWVWIPVPVAFKLETCVLDMEIELETSLETGVGVQTNEEGAGTTVVRSMAPVPVNLMPECCKRGWVVIVRTVVMFGHGVGLKDGCEDWLEAVTFAHDDHDKGGSSAGIEGRTNPLLCCRGGYVGFEDEVTESEAEDEPVLRVRMRVLVCVAVERIVVVVVSSGVLVSSGPWGVSLQG
jgi:hypothetical protein